LGSRRGSQTPKIPQKRLPNGLADANEERTGAERRSAIAFRSRFVLLPACARSQAGLAIAFRSRFVLSRDMVNRTKREQIANMCQIGACANSGRPILGLPVNLNFSGGRYGLPAPKPSRFSLDHMRSLDYVRILTACAVDAPPDWVRKFAGPPFDHMRKNLVGDFHPGKLDLTSAPACDIRNELSDSVRRQRPGPEGLPRRCAGAS